MACGFVCVASMTRGMVGAAGVTSDVDTRIDGTDGGHHPRQNVTKGDTMDSLGARGGGNESFCFFGQPHILKIIF